MTALRRWGMAVLAIVAVMAGCGSESSDEETPASAQKPASNSRIELRSPAVAAGGAISPRIQCGGGTIWLPLKWGSAPRGTEELILFWARFKEEGGRQVKVPFASMIIGISPEFEGMAVNTFPGEAEPRYYVSIHNCPPARRGQHFLVELFALDRRREDVPLDDRFATRLAEEALGVERFATKSKAAVRFRAEALEADRFVAIYTSL